MTLGQEFKTYAVMIQKDIERLKVVRELLTEINLGATAIGTGINTKPNYKETVIKHLNAITQKNFTSSKNLIEATQDTGVFVNLSGVFKRIVIKISKICNDLRLLSSGPTAGFNEINLPPLQSGSSIMPGKVNPVIPEVVNQVAFDVIGADTSISIACEHGQLQLNVFEPLVAFKLFHSTNMMISAFNTLSEKCIKGITANEEVCRANVLNSATLVTLLNPILGYEQSTKLSQEALKSGKRVYDLILEKNILTHEELNKFLDTNNIE